MKNTNNTTVYINNLSYDRDRNGIKSMFSKYGVIKNIKIIVDPASNQPRGMAFVEMGSHKEAADAIEGLNQKTFDGRTVKATWATPMKDPDRVFYASPAKPTKTSAKPKAQKDLNFKEVQLAKKARNEAKRKSNPLVFKSKSK